MKINVKVDKLGFSYGNTRVIHSFSHNFKSKKITGILGHNGCGKSTLIRNILGYLSPQSGSVTFLDNKGMNIEEENTKRSHIVSLVPQKSGDFSSIKVFNMVQMGRLPYMKNRWAGYSKEDRLQTEEILELLELTPFSDRILGMLSGGEQQKIMLARCLVQNTPVILLDEATASLDMHHSITIMEKIKTRVEQTGITVIAVMHDLNLAAQYCDELVFMKNGNLVEAGKASDVMTSDLLEAVYDLKVSVFKDENGIPFVLPGRKVEKRLYHA